MRAPSLQTTLWYLVNLWPISSSWYASQPTKSYMDTGGVALVHQRRAGSAAVLGAARRVPVSNQEVAHVARYVQSGGARSVRADADQLRKPAID